MMWKNVRTGFVFLAAMCCGLVASAMLAGCGGGGGGKNLAYTDPEWRESVNRSVDFPLAERIELRIGVIGRSLPNEENLSLQWIEEATNIDLVFESIPRSPGDIEFGNIIRRGELYDIIPEGKLPLSDPANREMLVDFTEFPELLPNVRALASEDPRYRDGLAAKMTLDGELYTLGRYDPERVPFVGSLAFRRDLFEKHELGYASWGELRQSLRTLKELYPDSSPFGGTPQDVYRTLPALFGSGYVENQVVYFDPEDEEWKFGPFEPEFEEFVRYFTELFAEEILLPEIFTMQQNQTRRYFASDTVFVAPYAGPTGPYFPFGGDDYGSVDENGVWDGSGKWVDAMPIPENRSGTAGTMTSKLYSFVERGWNVYNQSDHVGEAIALLDFLFDPEHALSAKLGAEGTVWESGDEGPVLTGDYAALFAQAGMQGVMDTAAESGTPLSIPLAGIYYASPGTLFGESGDPRYLYYRNVLAATYRPGGAIPLDPGLRISRKEEFDYERANATTSLSGYVEAQVAQFIVGRRSLDEYDDFLAECRERGADELLSLYRENSDIKTGSIF